ncbi:glycoside hydrolase family 15 protein [Egicoccus halophilus]|uniref:Glucoamylase n=1 Tax=Egicoccus halophilus TaxID=1670830 RepID=A0A8J3AB32_9ACTN|nr:glycoside hydrolase family 15 protein [Egicoccus halophilus]GGI09181.1 glucoamylase [Egicoccus halophilus]
MPLDPNPPFAPFEPVDGYLPIEDHGLIGDGVTTALVARDGSIPWACLPRFDSPATFAALLDRERGGHFTVQPEGLEAGRQRYVEDTGVLVTELRAADGTVEITDALTLQGGADLAEGVACDRQELVRLVRVTEGRVRLDVVLAPRSAGEVQRRSGGWYVRCSGPGSVDLQLFADRELDVPDDDGGDGVGLTAGIDLEEGDTLALSLGWRDSAHRFHPVRPAEAVEQTVEAWRRWIGCFRHDGPQTALVRRSALTLKMLDHFANGAMVAAPTASLPETIAGERNWDYRYAWIRDAAFSVYALRRVGMRAEASAFLGWVLDRVEPEDRPRVMYDIDGRQPVPEELDDELEGYRGSAPVRWGNAAAEQHQHDVFGEVLDCAYQWVDGDGHLDEHLWERLRGFVEHAAEEWDTPDHGIWEVRTPGRVFTYSAALCHVALDRGVRLAEDNGHGGDVDGWRTTAERIRDEILERAWDDERQTLTEHLGGGHLDASLLALPLRRVVPADHPRMVATTEAVVRELGAGDGLLFRYLPELSPDGLEGEEGAFLLCSFWLVDNLAGQGRLDEAEALYDSLCARANPLGLLPEQIDPATGAFLGNFPQAFSHVGVIASSVELARRRQEPA